MELTSSPLRIMLVQGVTAPVLRACESAATAVALVSQAVLTHEHRQTKHSKSEALGNETNCESETPVAIGSHNLLRQHHICTVTTTPPPESHMRQLPHSRFDHGIIMPLPAVRHRRPTKVSSPRSKLEPAMAKMYGWKISFNVHHGFMEPIVAGNHSGGLLIAADYNNRCLPRRVAPRLAYGRPRSCKFLGGLVARTGRRQVRRHRRRRRGRRQQAHVGLVRVHDC